MLNQEYLQDKYLLIDNILITLIITFASHLKKMKPNTLDKYLKPINSVAFRYELKNSNEIQTQFFVVSSKENNEVKRQQKQPSKQRQQGQNEGLSAFQQFNFDQTPSSGLGKQRNNFIQINQFLADSFREKNQSPLKNNQNFPKNKYQVKLQEIQNDINFGQNLSLIDQIQQLNENQSDLYSQNSQEEQQNLDFLLVKIQDDQKQMLMENRKKKGLTFISSKVSQLLRQKRKIKSNEIIKSIIQQLFFQPDPYKSNQQLIKEKQLLYIKQKKNIKRRIYDSLNVMVALGVIKKVKNQYVYSESIQQSVFDQQQLLEKRKDYCQKLQRECEELEEKLDSINNCYINMKALRKHNLQNEEKLGSFNQKTGDKTLKNLFPPYSEVKINFPFILVHSNDQKMQVELIRDDNEKQPQKFNDWTDMFQVGSQEKIKQVLIRGNNLNFLSDLDSVSEARSLIEHQNKDQNKDNVLQQFDMLRKIRQEKDAQINLNNFSYRVNPNLQ